jgi:hypothetical protein
LIEQSLPCDIKVGHEGHFDTLPENMV